MSRRLGKFGRALNAEFDRVHRSTSPPQGVGIVPFTFGISFNTSIAVFDTTLNVGYDILDGTTANWVAWSAQLRQEAIESGVLDVFHQWFLPAGAEVGKTLKMDYHWSARNQRALLGTSANKNRSIYTDISGILTNKVVSTKIRVSLAGLREGASLYFRAYRDTSYSKDPAGLVHSLFEIHGEYRRPV